MKHATKCFPLSFAVLFLVTSISIAQPRTDLMRFYDHGEGLNEEFEDVFELDRGGYAVCGRIGSIPWILRIDPDGELVWERTIGEDNAFQQFNCIIEADNGDFITGGMLEDQFVVARYSSNGNQIWLRSYCAGRCNAVVESKNGFLAFAGYEDTRAKLIYASADGDVINQNTFEFPGAEESNFVGMRETDEGFVLLGDDERGFGEWLTLVNFECRRVWLRVSDVPARYIHTSAPNSLVSTNGGFFYSGTGGRPNVPQTGFICRVDENGETVWYEFLDDLYGDGDEEHDCNPIHSIASIIGVGCLAVGNIGRYDGHVDQLPFMAIFSNQGEYLFGSEYERDNGEDLHYPGELNATVQGRDGSIIIVGRGIPLVDGVQQRELDAMLWRFEPIDFSPQFIYWLPEDTLLDVLLHDSERFLVHASDDLQRELTYLWLMNGDTISSDTSIMVEFENIGVQSVASLVSNGQFTSTKTWHVTVAEVIITDFTPDTLNLALRRGASVDFSIDSVRYTEGAEPEYLWTKITLANGHRDELGWETHCTVNFPWSGDYTVEGMAYRGESSDAVLWDVTVRGVVWAFVPELANVEVQPDSQIHFEVVPTEPENESIVIRWLLNEELIGEDTTAVDIFFAGADSVALFQVKAIVADSLEADTVIWTVNVTPLGVEFPAADPPRSAALLNVTPNPFNSTVTIRFAQSPHAIAGGVGGVSLTIHDITGREVARLVDEKAVNAPWLTAETGSVNDGALTPYESVTWDASSFPAGIYFARLESGGQGNTVKMVLVR